MAIAQQEEIETLKRRIQSLENRIGGVNYRMKEMVKGELVDNSEVVEQSECQFGMYTALCVETLDIWKQNRIRWFSPLFHKPTMSVKELPWANAVSPFGGFDDCGASWVAPAGSTVCILFENGNRASPYYIGTTWHRNRGPDGEHNWGFNIEEYYNIYEGKRSGYLVGPNDGSQCFPPWNTEAYNGYDITSLVDFASNPEAQSLLTTPNIYGFKTPEKHYTKMVDGDPKCGRKWKRFELMSSCGNWIMMKDDHLHYSGQWANAQCGGVFDGDTSCVSGANVDGSTDINDASIDLGSRSDDNFCEGNTSNSKIIGGHPSTGSENTKYFESQAGANPFFKHSQECRPYRGALTPQNNSCDLPQSGIQIMSISGHTLCMDDSVEEPSGDPTWDREFNFGCNDHYVGRMYMKSATGHLFEMSDIEGPQGDDGSQLRSEFNYIKLLSASGNLIELNDHTVEQKDCPGCPPNVAGVQRGIHIRSTSNHSIDLIDETNEQCSPCRMEGGEPIARAKKALMRFRTGYGLEMTFNDANSQTETDQQFIKILSPQSDNIDRGPHIQMFQEASTGPGQVYLRVGGNYLVQTYDNHTTIVGNEENTSDLIEIVSGQNLVDTKGTYFNVAQQHIFQAKDQIMLLAGEDCEPGKKCGGCGGSEPCYGAVLVYDYCSGSVLISDRVFASSSSAAEQLWINQLAPYTISAGCS